MSLHTYVRTKLYQSTANSIRKSNWPYLFLFFVLLLFIAPNASAQNQYSGRAVSLDASIIGLNAVVNDTGALPAAGGELTATLLSANVGTALTAGVLEASTVGAGSYTTSTATVEGLNLSVLGIGITAESIFAEATATCNGPDASAQGFSTIVNLEVAGNSVTITGLPNQVVALPLGLGQIIINEQIVTGSGLTREITVNALRISMLGLLPGEVVEVTISSAKAGITIDDSDCNSNSINDGCELDGNDCNGNGLLDSCEIAADSSLDCNANSILDECEIDSDSSLDCNNNGILDSCEIDADASLDCNNNGILDSCEIAQDPTLDCDEDTILDSCEIDSDSSLDCNINGILDSCEIENDPTLDCDLDTVLDSCQIDQNAGLDCNNNGILDSCDIADNTSQDIDNNGIPDECEGANLTVEVDINPSPAPANYPATMTVVVTNHGPAGATDVEVTNILPPGASVLSYTPDQGSCALDDDTTLSCGLGNLAPNQATTVTIILVYTVPGPNPTVTTVDSNEPDPSPEDNTNTEIVIVLPLGCNDTDTFPTDETMPPWQPLGWSIQGATLAPGLAECDFDTTNGGYRVRVYSNATQFRNAGWINNAANWLPYSAIDSGSYVRAKFYIFAEGAPTFNHTNEVPNIYLRLANRFAYTNLLSIYSHDVRDPGTMPAAAELRPSSDPQNPSVYRIDLDPVDVPFLQTTTTNEGILSGFEVFTVDPTDNGYVCLTELQMGCYQAAALNDALALETKIYEPTANDAGTLGVTSPLDFKAWNFVPPPENSPPGTNWEIETEGIAAYTEGPNGITIDSSAVEHPKIAYYERYLYPGPFTERMRIQENRIYKVRWHLTSTIPTSEQAFIWLRTRSCKFSYSNWLILGGANATNGFSNRALAQQLLPGIGCENPDKISSENGGWYTQIMHTPLDPDIRPEFAPFTPVSTRMPNLSAAPGAGANSLSIKDVKCDFKIIDTTSLGTGAANERSVVTLDRVEVRAFLQIPD